MKRLRSSDDLDSYSEKGSSIKDSSQGRSSSRSFYYKSDNVRRGGGLISPSSSSGRYDRDRSVDDDISNRESSRPVRKRSDHDFDGFDRRKGLGLGFDRYGGGGGNSRGEGYGGGDRIIHRSESFCGSRREFPKGFRSERDRSRREGSVSSWRRFGSGSKELEESRVGVVGRGGNEERVSGSGPISSGASRSSPKGLRDFRDARDVKSPTWSRDSGSEQTRTRDSGSEQSRAARGGGRDDGRGARSLNSKARSSPTWSKDSGSEQSKSVEVGKKSVEVEVGRSVEVEVGRRSVEAEVGKTAEVEVGRKSGDVDLDVDVDVGKSVVESEAVRSGASGKSSEMEEGELEPEPETVPRVVGAKAGTDDVGEGEKSVDLDDDCNKVVGETLVKEQLGKGEKELQKKLVSKGQDAAKIVDERPKFEENLDNSATGNMHAVAMDSAHAGVMEGDSVKEKCECEEEEGESMGVEKSMLEEKSNQDTGIDLEVKAEGVKVQDTDKEVRPMNGEGAKVNVDLLTESLGQNLKDKGKSVALSPALVTDAAENATWIEGEPRNVSAYRNGEDDMEGPSTRGFELFSCSPVRKVEKADQSGVSKQKDEKLDFEPLDLSLSLPNVLLPIGATRDTIEAPGSPSHGRSVQSFSSFRTNSDGFTASMSFSGSQSFFHNPSCSLTQNSLDLENLEQSVHSRPIFGGVDHPIWQTQSQNDSKSKDVPLYQRILMNGNGALHQSQAAQGTPNGQAGQGSSKMPNGLESQMSFHKQSSGGLIKNHDDNRSPSQSVGSHDIGSTYSFEKKRAMREKNGGSLYRSNSQKEREQLLIGGADFVETIIGRIVSDPIHIMAKKFLEMTGQSASCLKESIREIMLSSDKQGQLHAFQSVLQNRSELSLDMLLKAHRCQLEILVALKTGLPVYLNVDSNISSSDLAEVFLNIRCRNLTCQSLLPVDECDCKVCAKKDGFCSACMCLVCSKFDMASNTCSWVGCDVCLHWCHADCALRESYIRNGRSPSGTQGTPEMQFHCVACDHPSEMFGFVKEVFQNFAKDWKAEQFCKELEYVKRIFRASKDVRGRQLHEIADHLLAKLTTKSNLHEVYSNIMGFLTESDFSKFTKASALSGKEQENGSNGATAGPSHDASWLKSAYKENNPLLERSSSLRRSFQTDLNDKSPIDLELQRTGLKEPLFDELESIVRIKLAEAKMFQARADDARREAEGLKRIAVAKNEKIEEEYTSRLSKLRIVEAEEMRKQKFEEFQALERAHQEYFNMKMRMDADIKDLLLKMEATKRNLTM
ncbi:hypothetical protein Tsubulata_000563 [Turnera subulata]|uniref:Uncharacterized protein n=1 Tax=Turnera subulata TaxID=218843 RepID=A0A9Q0J9J1_9ROSI|nr:hypothetical protein Tsubulata_000563 [Turnera subulata]